MLKITYTRVLYSYNANWNTKGHLARMQLAQIMTSAACRTTTALWAKFLILFYTLILT